MLEVHHDWGLDISTHLPKFTHECVSCVCEQAQLTEVSSHQQIGARSRTSEGVSISLWTTWLGVTSPAPGDWRRKGAIKPPRYSSSTIPNYITDKMAVRLFPQASIKLPEGNFSRLSDHHHHRQVSSAPDQLYFVHPLHFAHQDGLIYIHATCRCNIPLPGYTRRGDYNYNSELSFNEFQATRTPEDTQDMNTMSEGTQFTVVESEEKKKKTQEGDALDWIY